MPWSRQPDGQCPAVSSSSVIGPPRGVFFPRLAATFALARARRASKLRQAGAVGSHSQRCLRSRVLLRTGPAVRGDVEDDAVEVGVWLIHSRLGCRGSPMLIRSSRDVVARDLACSTHGHRPRSHVVVDAYIVPECPVRLVTLEVKDGGGPRLGRARLKKTPSVHGTRPRQWAASSMTSCGPRLACSNSAVSTRVLGR